MPRYTAVSMAADGMSRRDWLGLTGAGLLLPRGWGEDATEIAPLNRFPRMLQEYYVARVRAVEQAALTAKMALRTPDQARRYQRDVRRRIRDCFGPFPDRTPLRARVTGTIERQSYRIEKVLFESRPGLIVAGNLYLPKGTPARRPGVIALCGHSNNGKAVDTYQSFTQGLAKQGYVVFIIDPIGQGERLQYPDERGGSRVGNGVPEHLHLGNQMLLTGENFPFWRAWDAIRALDYLETRPEVDPRRIGVTGNSGGGTVTTWLCGLDPRWAMAAPGCFVTTWRRNIENELPQDTEQYPLRALANGLDHDDFIAAMAPRPVILLAKEKDYFDVRGAEESYGRLKRLYTLLGAPQNIALFVGPNYHGYSRENREAMYRWFNRHRGSALPTDHSEKSEGEPEITLETDETLQVTPEGQVAGLGSRTVFSFTAAKSRRLTVERPPVAEAQLPALITRVLGLTARQGMPDARILREIGPRNYPRKKFTTYAVETEAGIQSIVYRLADESHYSRPTGGSSRTLLYVAHRSSDAELRSENLIRAEIAAAPEAAVFACDLRGSGESTPNTAGEGRFDLPYGSEYLYAGFSLMLGEPLAGRRTHDLLRVIDWLVGHGHGDIHLLAKGRGSLPATFAAVLCPRVAQVTLLEPLTSFADIAETEDYYCPLSCIVPDILAHFDLPDCYRYLARRRLRMIEPRRSFK